MRGHFPAVNGKAAAVIQEQPLSAGAKAAMLAAVGTPGARVVEW